MTKEELRERQGWSLDQKIDHSLGVIDQFYTRLNGKVYVSFSGGKDSTVLLWLARKIHKDIKACFFNTGNEYPEIVRFVRKIQSEWGNVDIAIPHKRLKDVIREIGFPLISKQTAHQIYQCRHNMGSKGAINALETENRFFRLPYKYRYLLDVNYDCSDLCCDILKKKPAHEYMVKNGLFPIIGTMASESIMRESSYIKSGSCNVFNNRDKRKQKSKPLSIWLDKDIWECIDKYNIEISDIYHKGMERTGCVCCGFGAMLKNDNRLQVLYDNYPKLYNLCMDYENNGVTYREALRELLKTNKLTLPDEKPNSLFD